MTKRQVCIVIAAYNEERVIGKTLRRLSKIIPATDIYVVDDGSVDKTAQIARKYTPNVLTKANSGKGSSLQYGIKNFRLCQKYKYITPNDADSILHPKFFDKIIETFEMDKDRKIAGIAGKVVGSNINWLTAYRLWEYEITQLIHKSAQSITNSITVCPGPCSVFRSSIFYKINYPKGTITEDMDLTFYIHRKKLGTIVYEPQSLAYTQDPKNLKSYIQQINRWYTGFWQCVIKHNIPTGRQLLDLEVSLLCMEGIFSGLFVLSSPLLVFLFIGHHNYLFLYAIITDFLLFVLPSTLYVASKFASPKILLYIPHFYFLRAVSSLIFIRNYGIVFLGRDRKLSASWDTARYSFQKFSSIH
ncbi:glycosyltransferase [Candidatus Woesebacteria bacterium]|nr:MAG: glycosyltransferase [Candidatus Woesebacteria bacterium]